MSDSPTSDTGATPALASRHRSLEPDIRTYLKPSRPGGLPSSWSTPLIPSRSRELPILDPNNGSLSPYRATAPHAPTPFIGTAPPFPVPGGLLMINKKPDEVRVRRFNDVLKRIEPPLIDHLLKWTIKRPRHNPTAIRLVMLGQSEADAKMYMVVFCEQRVRRRAKKFFSSSLALELCKPQGAPEHAIEVLVVDPPIPVARTVAQLPARNRGPKLSGMTVGHAIEELENPVPPVKVEDEQQDDSESEMASDSRDQGTNVPEAAPSTPSKDLMLLRSQRRENPWESNSVMLTALKAIPGPDTTAYYDWALVDIGDLARNSGVYNVPKTTGLRGVSSLMMPSSRRLESHEDSPVTLMSSEGPKDGTISFVPLRLLLSPGRTFIDTYMIKMYDPHVITHGDSGSWVINTKSGLVYGHLVATDVLGGGHVIPLLDTIDDMKDRLGATSVELADDAETRIPPRERAVSPSPRSSPEPPSIALGTRPDPNQRPSPRSAAASRGSSVRQLAPPDWNVVTRDHLDIEVFSTKRTSVFGPQADQGAEFSSIGKPDLIIHSRALVCALRSVIRYYPDSDLAASSPTFTWPYAELVHHYEDLKKYAEDSAPPGNDLRCRTKVYIIEHTQLLTQFLDTQIMPRVREELDRNKKGLFTFDMAWVSHKPGTTVVWNGNLPILPPQRSVRPDSPSYKLKPITSQGPFVIQDFMYGDRAGQAEVRLWSLEYDGQLLGKAEYYTYYRPFSGQREISWRVAGTASLNGGDFPQGDIDRIRQGKTYWNLVRQIQCRQYTAESAGVPRRAVDSLVMVDCREALKQQNLEGAQLLFPDERKDLANWAPGCSCPFCEVAKTEDNRPRKPEFADYVSDPKSKEELTDHQYFLCPSTIRGFDLNSQEWVELYVEHLATPKWDRSLVNTLVMDSRQKHRIMRLFEAHSRAKKANISAPKGKRIGLALLLHGPSGSGKTLTAGELTSGMDNEVGQNKTGDSEKPGADMTELFRLANAWGLIIHITDADLLYEPKPPRVQPCTGYESKLDNTGDTASRHLRRGCHLKNPRTGFYPLFSEDESKHVWNNLLAKFEALGIGFSYTAREFISSPKMKNRKWTGSEMRRILESAAAVAKPADWGDEGEDGEQAKPFVDVLDLEDVVELSDDFRLKFQQLML
ncbi:hypothetical protein PG997_010622 [Apiospora hydei]|uniref:AAA+ ATPase domain-containing protein n=1 Tax=Apiospora hydei TaxID=1337664 RepID=A0ABR1VGS5_9PEZI